MSYSNPNNGTENQNGNNSATYGQSYQNNTKYNNGYGTYTEQQNAPTGGLASGQNTINAEQNSEWETMPTNASIGGYQYANPASFADTNAANIYGVINNQINNRANMAAPTAQNTNLGPAASLGPLATSTAAQLAPTQMYSGSTINSAQDQQYAAAQNQLINQLNAQAQGVGPSVALTQQKQAQQQSAANAIAALASQRGASNPALAQRAAQTQLATVNAQAAQNAAVGTAQEQLNAQNQLNSTLSGARGQTQSLATNQAQLQQAAGLANQSTALAGATQNANLAQTATLGNATNYNAAAQQQAALEQQQILQSGAQNQQTSLANLTAQGQQNQLNAQVYGQGLTAYQNQNQTDISNQVALQQLLASQQSTLAGLNVGQAINSQNNSMGLAGAGISGGASLLAGLAAVSDRRGKKNIRAANNTQMKTFLAMMGA